MTTFAVIDHASHNVLGEYADRDDARALWVRLIETDPTVEHDLEIRAVEAEAPEPTRAVAVAS
jgi:hypothetical protein